MKIIEDFVFKINVEVSWGDMDAMNHVNNIQYLKYFEDSRIAYYEAVGIGNTINSNKPIGVVKAVSCEYILPIRYPSNLEVGTRIIEMSDIGFTMEHYIMQSERLCAFGETEIVMIDNKTLKPRSISDRVKQAINKLELNKI